MRDDLRFALRQLIKTPGFTLIAIVTLAFGIGANTSAFSMVNHIMLKPLPYADSAQLDRIYRATAQNPEGAISAADFLDARREIREYRWAGRLRAGDRQPVGARAPR